MYLYVQLFAVGYVLHSHNILYIEMSLFHYMIHQQLFL